MSGLRVWTGFPLPWDANGQLDRGALDGLLRHCAAAGTHGLYIGGTAAEFFSLDQAELEAVTGAFLELVAPLGALAIQVGCGGHGQREVEARVRFALANGCSTVQVPLPGWLALTDDEVLAFYGGLAEAVPQADIYVYDTAAAGRRIGSALWPRLLEQVPRIVGAKIGDVDEATVAAIRAVRGDFAILVAEQRLTPLWHLAVHEVAAWTPFAFPDLLPRLAAALAAGDREAIEQQVQAIDVIEHDIKAPLRARGYRAGTMHRLMGLATGYLPATFARVRPPWRHVQDDDVQLARQLIASYLGREYLRGD